MDHDRLEGMFKHQLYMQTNVFKALSQEMTTQQRVDFISWNVLALQDELHEALQETSWKPWAEFEYLDREAFTKELVDAWHFLMNLFLVVHPDADSASKALFDGYNNKTVINEKRQHDGYDGVSTKCPNCKRALDDITSD